MGDACIPVCLGPFPAVEFAPELPPNSPQTGARSASSLGLRHFGAGNFPEVVPIPGKPPDQAAIVRF